MSHARSCFDKSDLGSVQRKSWRRCDFTSRRRDVVRPERCGRCPVVAWRRGRAIADAIGGGRPAIKIIEGHDVRLSCAAGYIHGKHSVIGKSVIRVQVGAALMSKVNFAGYMLGATPPVPRLILQSRIDVAWCSEEVSRTPCPVKILAFRRLPTEDRPRIVLHGDQGIDLANARIERVARAPILTMPLECSVGVAGGCAAACSPGRSVVRNWPLELQPKRPSTQRTHNARWDAEKVFRTMVLQFDSVQYSANGHITCRILSSAAPMFIPHVGASFVECNNYLYNTVNSPGWLFAGGTTR